jgi:Uma2 family endonuclease
MSTAVSAITPDEFYRMGDAAKGFELVNGELKELHVSKESSHIAGEVYLRIKTHCNARQPGWVFPEGTSYCCFPTHPSQVRKPDTSFIAAGRMSRDEYYEEGHCQVVPDLVVEVVSPTDIAEELEDKIEEWLAAGAKLLWEIYPNSRTVRAHRPDGTITLLRAADTLTAPDILPGFACPVGDLFEPPV